MMMIACWTGNNATVGALFYFNKLKTIKTILFRLKEI